MNKFFYLRLALQNIRRNRRFYYPYLLTGTLTVAMFYNLIFTSTNPSIRADSASLATILALGTIVVGLFAIIFLLYTNSFLMKRRQKELGLYNILGMEKRHIGRIMLWETVFTCLFTILAGLLLGILMSKLLMLLIFKLLFFTVHYGFLISPLAIIITALLFCGIYFLALCHNLIAVRRAKPIELLHGGNAGEREPKAKWPLVLIGIITLGAGYAIAIITKQPLQALMLFFVAVVLVIIGTYCLFTAGSIALLKLLKRNKKYYYQTRHFTGVSGMLYRMKQNAVGLSNICILCTMVLVTISTTVCLYIGTEDSLESRYASDIELGINMQGSLTADTSPLHQDILDIVAKHGLTVEKEMDYTGSSIAVSHNGSDFYLRNENYSPGIVQLLTAQEYERLTGVPCPLSKGEVMLCSLNTDDRWDAITIDGEEYRVATTLESVPISGEYMAYMVDSYCLIVPDNETYLAILGGEDENAAARIVWTLALDLSGTEDEKLDCYHDIQSLAGENYYEEGTNAEDEGEEQGYYLSTYSSRQAAREDFYSLYGGLLFLGIFLGLLFLMATVLIIYYKQVSEGYEDKERFEIMQKVGMSHGEVRATIRSQILIVFFLPLAAAFLHLAMAFPMISRLLVVLNLRNVALFATCTLATIAVFALVYAGVYALTARTYYKIVES